MATYMTYDQAARVLIGRGFHERGDSWHRHPEIDDSRPSVIVRNTDGSASILHRDDSPAHKKQEKNHAESNV